MRHKNASKLKVADLFSGCGGMTQGFVQTGHFESVFALDNNKFAIETYRQNFDKKNAHSHVLPIQEFLEDYDIPKVDVVIGGPPCQGFSLLNKNREGDERRTLWQYFIDFAVKAQAQVTIMENVPQLLTSEEYSAITAAFSAAGFRYIISGVLNAANYGASQNRSRAFIIASREKKIPLPIPEFMEEKRFRSIDDIFLKDVKIAPWRTVRHAIADLPAPEGTEIRDVAPPLDLHFGRNPTPMSVERYKAIPPGGNRFDLQRNRPDITPNCWLNKPSGSTDLFGRLWWDRPSVTIRTEFYKPEKGRYLHPVADRPITHREAARLQSFPDYFVFSGNKIEIAKQIGNAVPPLLAQAVAKSVANALNGYSDDTDFFRSELFFNQILRQKIDIIQNEFKISA